MREMHCRYYGICTSFTAPLPLFFAASVPDVSLPFMCRTVRLLRLYLEQPAGVG